MTKAKDIDDGMNKDEEERLLRKRAAARARQQRCRARKKAAVLEQRLPQARGKEADEIKKELEQIQQFATPAKVMHRKKLDEPSPFGIPPYPHMGPPHHHPGYPPFMMPFPHHPVHMMMPPPHHPGMRSPKHAMIDPTVMGSPAKYISADSDLLAKILDDVEPAQYNFNEEAL